MSYLKNAWYPIAWTDEVTPDQLFSRIVAEEAIVLYRKQDGSMVALQDRCPHRFLPLHRGRLRDDAIHCGYHGLAFSSDGHCIGNPQGPIPSEAKVRTFPVEEAYHLLWVWLGSDGLADRSKIPNYDFLTKCPPSARAQGYLFTSGNYQLVTDNIMDLSHIDFLHQTTLGGGGISQTRPKVEQIGERIIIKWASTGQQAPPIVTSYLPHPDSLVDQFMEVEWVPPGSMTLTNTIVPQGFGEEHHLVSKAIHLSVPETATTAHYFWGGFRSYVSDPEVTRHHQQIIQHVFATEDKPALEAIQSAMGDGTDILAMKPLVLPSDMGALRARRVLQKLIAAESASA